MWAKGRDLARGRAEVTQGAAGRTKLSRNPGVDDVGEAPEFRGDVGNRPPMPRFEHCRNQMDDVRFSARSAMEFPTNNQPFTLCWFVSRHPDGNWKQ